MKSIIPRTTKFNRAPKYPISGQHITSALKECVDAIEMRASESLQQKRFGQLLGIPKSTIHEWFHADQIKPVQRFLSGLERLGELDRLHLLRKLCRPCPRVTSSRITADPDLLTGLMSAMKIRHGITFVIGATVEARTYVVTAMGNSLAAELDIGGIDRHRPLTFVPVPGVHYPDQVPTTAEIAGFLGKIPTQGRKHKDLVILNGVWRELLGIRIPFFDLARDHHLLIADDISIADVPRSQVPIQVVHVEERKDPAGKPTLHLRWSLQPSSTRKERSRLKDRMRRNQW